MSQGQRGDPAGPVPVSAPPRVRDRLRAAPDGPLPVLHRSPHALYVDLGGWCVGVVGPGGSQVPNAVRSRLGVVPSFSCGSAYLDAGVLHIDSRPLPVGRAVDVRAPRIDLRRTPRSTAGSTTDLATPPASVVEFVASELPHGRLDAPALTTLVGRGPGLTPLGDDIVCGWLSLHRSVGCPTPDVDLAVADLGHRTTLLSATLLDCAVHGEVLPDLAAYLRALGTAAEAACAVDLLGIGGTSGAGLLAGVRLALDALGRSAKAAA